MLHLRQRQRCLRRRHRLQRRRLQRPGGKLRQLSPPYWPRGHCSSSITCAPEALVAATSCLVQPRLWLYPPRWLVLHSDTRTTWPPTTTSSTRICRARVHLPASAPRDTGRSSSARTLPMGRSRSTSLCRAGSTAPATVKTSWIRASSKWGWAMPRATTRSTPCIGFRCSRHQRDSVRSEDPRILTFQFRIHEVTDLSFERVCRFSDESDGRR